MADITFDGDTDSDWGTAANWSGNSLPTSSDRAILNGTTYNGAVTVADGDGGTVDQFQMLSSYTGTFTINDESIGQYGRGLSTDDTNATCIDIQGSQTINGSSSAWFSSRCASGGTHDISWGTGAVVWPNFGILQANGSDSDWSGTVTFKRDFIIQKDGSTSSYLRWDTSNPDVTFEGNVESLNAWDTDDWRDRVEHKKGTGTITFAGSNNQNVNRISMKTGFINASFGDVTINKSGGTMSLTSDLYFDEMTFTAGTIDMKGYDIYVDGNVSFAAGTTIQDTVGDGKIIISSSGTLNFNGASGNVVTVNDVHFDITSAGTVTAEWCDVTDSVVTGGTITATDTIDGGGNTNWSITAPSGGSAAKLYGALRLTGVIE